MAKDKNPDKAPAASPDGKSRNRLYADVVLSPYAGNAQTAQTFSIDTLPDSNLMDVLASMQEKAGAVIDGDTAGVEALLVSQAIALDKIFNEMARRAALNMGEHMGATDVYMRLALKAQTQSRSTLQTLTDIKNPRQVAFVKQANIAHGHQQVNNGMPPGDLSHARAGKTGNKTNELSGGGYELSQDTRASAHAVGINPQMETVGEINRATDDAGKAE